MAKGVAKNKDGLMIKSYDLPTETLELTTDINEAYNYGFMGEQETNNDLDFLRHHMGNVHEELETMKYTVVAT
jgi:hypothetical protein